MRALIFILIVVSLASCKKIGKEYEDLRGRYEWSHTWEINSNHNSSSGNKLTDNSTISDRYTIIIKKRRVHLYKNNQFDRHYAIRDLIRNEVEHTVSFNVKDKKDEYSFRIRKGVLTCELYPLADVNYNIRIDNYYIQVP